MKLNQRTVRGVAIFFLVEISGNIVAPTLSYALTTGPSQTEFTSYEPTGTTDMVNLITGDFTYNVPLIDVPGPEGSFSLPLSYHSGIGLEDEASWAGLGWNVNAGSISRNKISGADDDYDNITSINVQDPGGSGYVKNYPLYQRSWDSEKGYGGAISLGDVVGFSWDRQGAKDGSVMGATFNKDKASFDAGKFINGVTTIISLGVGGALSQGASAAAQTGRVAFAQGLVQQAISAAEMYSAYKTQRNTSTNVGGWSIDKDPSYGGMRVDYKYWLDNTRVEHSYGALYLGQMKNNTSVNPNSAFGTDNISWPRVGTPANWTPAPAFPQALFNDTGTPSLTSDMYSYVEPNTNYAWSFNPTHVAYDAYAVMGPGVGGMMAPYRPDIGSLIFPKKMNRGSLKVNLAPFLEEGVDISKIQFKFNGDLSNSYGYHNSNGTGMAISYNNHSGTSTRRVYYQVSDPKLVDNTQRTEQDRDGLYNKRLAQGKHVEWFSNDEMASNTPAQSGKVMEYRALGDASRITNRNTIWPTKGIGAYAITNSDGTTYHYALPVYNKKEESFSGITSNLTQKFARSTSGDIYSRNATEGEWYATTWLLTGITGPDFVDQGQIGSIDSEDLGYWVKFDYGRFAQFYQWRFPYTDYTVDGTTSAYSKGVKETYYLNTIQTRTHTALFLKDIRKDARGSYTLLSGGNTPSWAATTDFKYPASSLALSEIVLLNNADFQQLQSNGFIKNSTTGATVDQNQLNAPSATGQPETCSLRDVYDVYDVQANASFRSFLDEKAQRKVVLNTSYALCPSTINSFASASTPPALTPGTYSSNRMGKLTLHSVSYFGPNNSKLFPDFSFGYGLANPAYDKDAWDGWGAYKANGTNSHYSYGSDPTAWHLTDIVSPLGGRTVVEYESDDYSSVSGQPIRQQVPITGFQPTDGTHGTLTFNLNNIAPFTLPQLLSNGAMTTLQSFKAQQTRQCWGPTGYDAREYYDYNIPSLQQIQNLQNNSFTITRPTTSGGSGNTLSGCPDATWHSATGFLEVTLATKRGGGVRVSSVALKDEDNNQYKTGYIYTQNGLRNGTTSGVVAQEPELVRTADYPFYHLYDFPNTPVLYAKVTVVEGMKSDTDFTHKTEYNFNTPDQTCVQATTQLVGINDNLNWAYYGSYIQNSKLFYHDVQNRASRVGRIESIRTIDRDGSAVGNVVFGYTDQLPRDQGKFTTGSLMCEVAQGPNVGDSFHFKLSRTSDIAYPNVLTSIRTTSNGVTAVSTNSAWDFLTGKVVLEEMDDANGRRVQTTTVPAHTKYSELRSKAENVTNKHLLDATAANYTYQLDGSGNREGLIAAQVQTWNKNWATYRAFDNGTDLYQLENNAVPVWRRHKSFQWNDNQVNNSGTTALNTFTDFNWAVNATQSPKWLAGSEITQYNHFAQPLEVRDLNGNFTARKFGHNETQMLAHAANAKYTELAYSGAEDATLWGHFSGEVRDGGRKDALYHHTGAVSIKLQSQETGFTYKAMVGSELTPGRTYRLSAWLHNSDLNYAYGALYATLNGNSIGTARINSSATKKAGDWYLLNLDISIPTGTAGQMLVVGCRNSNSVSNGPPVYFDDFRFHPLDARMQSYVYDTKSWQVTDVLNDDNLSLHYEYDTKGKLYRVYKEVLDRPNEAVQAKRLVKEYLYNYGSSAQFSNQAISVTAQRNNCGLQMTGSFVTYTVPAGTYTSTISTADANAKAQQDADNNSQTYANNHGSCVCKPIGTVISVQCTTVHTSEGATICRRTETYVAGSCYPGTRTTETPGSCNPNCQ